MKLYACFYPYITNSEQHLAAHRLLSFVLKREYGIEEYCLEKNSHGKPLLHSHPHIKINLSHCKGIILCGVSEEPLGVDCECRRELRMGAVKRACSRSEQEEIMSAKDKDLAFTRIWTLKESFVKAIGRGISYPMKNAVFSLENGVAANIKGAYFYQYVIDNRCVISACSPDKSCTLEIVCKI